MSGPAIYIEVDGKPVPAKDIVWLQYAPCGCISGVSSINQFEIFTDGEEAFERDTPKVVREYRRTEGFTFKAVTTEQYRDTYADQFKGPCKCTPQWGIDPIPVPEGWTWRTTDGTTVGRNSFRKHIIPAVAGDSMAKVSALCGKEESQWRWRDDKFGDLHDTIPCAKCEKRARDTSPVLVPVGGVTDVPVAGEVL